MVDAFKELQALADERGLFTHWWAERSGNRVQIMLQTGLDHGQQPLLCKTVEFPLTNQRAVIEALAVQALGYWRAVLATGQK